MLENVDASRLGCYIAVLNGERGFGSTGELGALVSRHQRQDDIDGPFPRWFPKEEGTHGNRAGYLHRKLQSANTAGESLENECEYYWYSLGFVRSYPLRYVSFVLYPSCRQLLRQAKP